MFIKTLILYLSLTYGAFICLANPVFADAEAGSDADIYFMDIFIDGVIDIEPIENGLHEVGSSAINIFGDVDEMFSDVDYFVEAFVFSAFGEAEVYMDGGVGAFASTYAFSDQLVPGAAAFAVAGSANAFQVIGSPGDTGTVTVTAGFELIGDALTETPYDMALTEAGVGLGIGFHLGDDNYSVEMFDEAFLPLELYLPDFIFDFDTGELSVSLEVAAGDIIVAGIGAYSETIVASTPVPASFILLGTGLLSLAMFRIRKRFA